MDLQVTRSSIPPFTEYVAEIESIWDSHWLTNMGEKHRALESELSNRLGVPNVSLFTNGHSALECALEALRLEGEVITTPFTFASTTHAIVRKGLKPVFCDIRSDDYTIDASKIEPLVTEKTSAIIPVHVYGNVCDVESIQKIADKYGLKVIYDAAHAFGIEYLGRGIGNYGDISMFSFHATKVFNTIEGGALTFADNALYDILYKWKNFGIMGPEDVEYVGGNAKMNEFCAAMGLCNLRHVDEEIEKRHAADERYRERLEGVPGLVLNRPRGGASKNYAYFPVLIDERAFGCTRDGLCDALAKEGIFARKYFYPLTSAFDCYKGWFGRVKTPVAETISRNIATLPLYAGLSDSDVDEVCRVVLDARG